MSEDAEWVVREHRTLGRYVLSTERVVLVTRHHWGRLLEPAATATVVFAVAALVPLGFDVLWWLGLVALGRVGWRFVEWRREWFVATDKRMLLLTGILTRKVAMMPLHKVTDMSFLRSIPGRVLGYGEFVLESAGQDQAMRRITWVPRPDTTYRSLCATIFGPSGVALPEHLRPAAVASPVSLPGPHGLPPVFPPSGVAPRRWRAPTTVVRDASDQGTGAAHDDGLYPGEADRYEADRYEADRYEADLDVGTSTDPELELPFRPDRDEPSPPAH